MKTEHIDNFIKGWFVGKFEPSLLKDNFEVGLHQHKAGEFHQDHYHKLGTEINLMVEGSLRINGQIVGPGDIFVLEPYEISQVEYLTDVKLVVVRNISNPNDKYEINTVDKK
jgi:quercetin dioxygenase-like cupin family protein